MGCIREATLSVSGAYMVRVERTFQGERLATESRMVLPLP